VQFFYFYLTYTLTITDIQCLFDVRCNRIIVATNAIPHVQKVGKTEGKERKKMRVAYVHSIMHLDFPEPFFSLSGKTTALIASSNTCFKPF